MHARGAVGIAQGLMWGGGVCARRWGGPTRRRARIARDGFESASTHEAVELPAGVAALHTALAKVDRDNLTHFVRGSSEWIEWDRGTRQLAPLWKQRFWSNLQNPTFDVKPWMRMKVDSCELRVRIESASGVSQEASRRTHDIFK
jgi:hypothetical protein